MKLQRSISTLGLLFTSIGCMIGSGWLFGAYYAAQIAGPAAIVSWVLGGVMVMFIALTFSELSSMLPLSGGIARYSHFSHGTLVSFCMSWLAWLSCVAVAPTEVQAMLQYSSLYFPWLIDNSGSAPVLTGKGILLAACIMAMISWLNILGVRFLTRFNSFITAWKLIIPVVTVLAIMCTQFHIDNFTEHSFAPDGWHGILWALPTAGIVFSFLGFREATSLAGEAKLPGKALPLAVLGSVSICIVLYLFVQIGFIGALPASSLSGGFTALSFSGSSGPFAGIAAALGLQMFVLLIYVDSLMSPFGTGMIYTATTARLNYAMSINQYTPAIMLQLNKSGIPAWAVLINTVIGTLMLMPLPSWQALVGFQSTAIVLAYGVGPIALLALRKQAPTLHRPFKLPAAKCMCAITFTICNLLAYWTGWETIWRLMFSIAIGFIILSVYRAYSYNKYCLEWRSALWLFPYFLGLTLISYLGTFGGGIGVIGFGWDFGVIGLFSLFIMHIAYQAQLTKDSAELTLICGPQSFCNV